MKHSDENKDYLDAETKEIVKSIENIVTMDRPYNKIHELPMMIEKYNDKLLELYENEADQIRPILTNHKNEVLNYLEGTDFADELRGKYVRRFDELMERLNSAKQFNEILAMPQLSQRTRNACIDDINREIAARLPKPQVTSSGGKETNGNGQVSDPPSAPPKVTRTLFKSNLIPYQPIVETEEDIEKILSDLRVKLEKELKEKGEFKLV